jgi:hypothetical protein
MYNVVFRYREDHRTHAGIITWTSFLSKEEWEQSLLHSLEWQNTAKQEVIAEGVTPEEAINLTRSTPREAYLRAEILPIMEELEESVNGLLGKLSEVAAPQESAESKEDPTKPKIKVFWLETPDGEKHLHTGIPYLLEEAKAYLNEMEVPDSIVITASALTQEEIDALPEL